MAWAYSLALPAPQLAALLHSLESDFGHAILENVACLRFVGVARPPDEFHFDSGFNPQEWELGRAFGGQMELRWRRRGNLYASLLIVESRLTLADDLQAEITLPEPIPLERDEELLKVILWGEWQDPEEEEELPDKTRHWWYEERIPQFLGYPWTSKDNHLALEVARYRAPAPTDAEPFPGDFIYRFVRLVAMPIVPVITPPDEEPEEETAEFEEEEDD